MGSQRYNFEDAITNMFIEYTESAITEVELNELTNEVRNSIRNIIIRRATEADLSAQLAVEQARELVQRAINQNHINQNHIVPINILSPSIAMRSMPQFVDILTEETEETEEIEETELISKIEMVEEEVLNKEGCSICSYSLGTSCTISVRSSNNSLSIARAISELARSIISSSIVFMTTSRQTTRLTPWYETCSNHTKAHLQQYPMLCLFHIDTNHDQTFLRGFLTIKLHLHADIRFYP